MAARRVALTRLAAGALALGVAGCGLVLGPPPDWVTNRIPLDLCGTEEVEHGDGLNAAARRCLLEAFEAGRGAELITMATSVEGDPIVRYVRVHANGTIEIFHDATRDRFGSGTWERLRCDRIVAVEGPDVFVEEGCESLPLP